MNIEVTSVAIPSSALAGAAVPVSITLTSLVIPATMYAMRAVALFTKYPYDGTAPTTIVLTPTSEVNDAISEEQTFAGSFVMPAWSVNAQFEIEYQVVSGGAWVAESTQSGVVTMTPVPSTALDMSSLMSMMIQMMIVVMMMKMMTGAMSTIK